MLKKVELNEFMVNTIKHLHYLDYTAQEIGLFIRQREDCQHVTDDLIRFNMDLWRGKVSDSPRKIDPAIAVQWAFRPEEE